MDPLSYLFRLFHIIPAVLLGGGILFMWTSLIPGTQSLDADARKAMNDGVRGKWAKIVMICSALLLGTGLYNAFTNIKTYELPPLYHALVMVKLLLGLAIMFIAARLSGRSATAEKFREKTPFWVQVSAILVLVLIASGSAMKVIERTPKTAIESDETKETAVLKLRAPSTVQQSVAISKR